MIPIYQITGGPIPEHNHQSSTTKIVAAGASEMFIPVYQTAQPHIPEDHLTLLF
jgi:hypothetical protein